VTGLLDRLFGRMIGALRLDPNVYEEIEADKSATGEAAFIVVATSLVSGAANGVLTGVPGGLAGALASFIGWVVYAWVAYVVGTRLLPGKDTKADWGELGRTLGYANTPRFFIVLVLLPGVASLIRAAVGLWVTVATVVALQAALDISTGRAIVIAIVSALAQLFIIAFALSYFG
jgi:hypothetical protein